MQVHRPAAGLVAVGPDQLQRSLRIVLGQPQRALDVDPDRVILRQVFLVAVQLGQQATGSGQVGDVDGGQRLRQQGGLGH